MTDALPTFDAQYMRKRMFLSWRGEIIADAVAKTLNPRHVVDFGCATGDIARGLLDLGIQAWGVDSSPAAGGCLPPSRFIQQDLVKGFFAPPEDLCAVMAYHDPLDLVILLEVLSILPDRSDRRRVLRQADIWGSTLLVNRLDRGDRKWLGKGGKRFCPDKTDELRRRLEKWGHRPAVKALYRTGEVWA